VNTTIRLLLGFVEQQAGEPSTGPMRDLYAIRFASVQALC